MEDTKRRGRPAARKTITSAGPADILPSQQNPTIILQSPELFHFDILKYTAALQNASMVDFYNRTLLYDIYHSIITTDGHLSGIINKRLSAVARERFEFQRDGKPVDEVNAQIKSPWFRAFVKEAVNSKLWGFTLCQFRRDEKGWITFDLIDRKHYDPVKRQVIQYETDVTGAPLELFANCLVICDNPRGLGQLATCAPYALYKRGNLGDWAQFCQIFGMPIREYTYTAGDEEARKRLLADARKQGANAVYIHPEGSTMTLHEAQGKSGTNDLYERFTANCNDEMSIAILGNTLTTKSSENGTQALGTVQAKEQMKITEDDVQFVLDLLNYDMTDIFAALGVDTTNGEFVRVEEKYYDKQVQINVVSKLKEMGLPMSDDYLYKTFDVEKPDDYEAMKAQADAEKAAAAERARQIADQLNQKPTGEEKARFFDRFLGFFRPSPAGRGVQRRSFALLVDGQYRCTCPVCSSGEGFRNESAQLGITFSPKALADGLRAIYYKEIDVHTEIETHIFEETLRQFNLATAKGLAESQDPEVITDRFLYELRTNNAVFSAFRTHRMQNDIAAQLIDPETGRLKSFDRWKLDIKGMTDHYCNAWLKTEYDTAIIRAHQAADWKHFLEEADIFPNIRWMPTTSVTPDPLHQHYWEKKLTLPINHPFWQEHRPGDRWNCKCSLEQTDDPVNASALDGYTPPLPMPGLDNNPAKDGKLFSDTHPYYTEAYPGAEDATKKLLDEKTYTFMAHTVEEAEKFVTDYIADRVDFPFKKSQLESASKALSLLKERMDYYGLSKFSILRAPDKKGALAAFEDFDNSFRISPKLFGDLTKIFENEQKFLKRYGYPYSTMHTSVDDILRSVIDHELGHAIKFRHPEWQGKIMRANASDKGSTKILGYDSSTNLDEYFAEVISAYWGPLYKDMSKVEIDLVEDLFKEAGFKMKPLKL